MSNNLEELQTIVEEALVEFGSQTLCSGDMVRSALLDVWNAVHQMQDGTPEDTGLVYVATRADEDA